MGKENFDNGLAKDFAERGVSVPFESAALIGARLRIYDKRKEVSTAKISETGLRYVVSLATVENAFAVSVNDRVLIEALKKSPTVDPGTVRNAVRTMELTGIYGDDRLKKAQAEILSNKDRETSIFLRILMRASEEVGNKVPDIRYFAGENGNQAIDTLFTQLAAGGDKKKLYQNVTEWAGAIRDAGLEGSQSYMRKIRDDVIEFSRQIRLWGESLPSEETSLAFGISDYIECFRDICEAQFMIVDGTSRKVRVCLNNWDTAIAGIRKSINTLDWTIDGWPEILDLWNGSIHADVGYRRECLYKIASRVPLLPQEVLKSTDVEKRDRFAEAVRKKNVSANHDWLSGEHQDNVMSRLSKIRDRRASASMMAR